MMKIVFLNVWGEDMQENLVEYLEEQARDTDIFCFQEATEPMKQACADALSKYDEISDYKYISDHENFPQSTFVRKDIEVLSSGTLMRDDMDRGLAVYVKVRTENGDVYICNAHGKSRPVEKLDDPGRLAFSKTLIKFFGDKGVPVVIGGDFNLMPDTSSAKMFGQSGYRDLIQEYAIDTTRNHLAWDRYPVKMYYSDYVFINDKVQLKSFAVPKNEVSDHLPLLVEIDTKIDESVSSMS